MVADAGPAQHNPHYVGEFDRCSCRTCKADPASAEASRHSVAHAAFADYLASMGEQAHEFVPPSLTRMNRAVLQEFDPSASRAVCLRFDCRALSAHPRHES